MASLFHATKGSVVTASACTSRRVGLLVQNVILVILDRFGRKKMSKLMTAGVLVSPLLDGREHVALNLDAVTASSRVVKGVENIIGDLVDGDIGVLPGIEYASIDD